VRGGLVLCGEIATQRKCGFLIWEILGDIGVGTFVMGEVMEGKCLSEGWLQFPNGCIKILRLTATTQPRIQSRISLENKPGNVD
jgi:hypothetical protein